MRRFQRAARTRGVIRSWSTRRSEPVDPSVIQSLFAAHDGAASGDSSQPLFPLRFAASDDLNLKGFATRYGVAPSMLHRAPGYDHKLLEWIRKSGGTFVGKLNCESPFSLLDCSVIEKLRASSAVELGACDVAVVSSGVGPAAIVAPCSAPVFAFKPSTSSLPRPVEARRRSIGLVFGDFQMCDEFWHVMTGQLEGEAKPTRKLQTEAITVGVPTQWINQLFDSHAGTALLELLRETTKSKGWTIEEVGLNWEATRSVDRALTLVRYHFHKKLQSHGLEGAGVLEQLDEATMAHVLEGGKITEEQIEIVFSEVDRMRSEFTEEMAGVDCLCLPVTAPPFQSFDLRTIGTLLPFSLINCPLMSFRYDAGLTSTGKASVRSMLKKFAVGEGEQFDWRELISDEASSEDGRIRSIQGKIPIAFVGEPGQDTVLMEAVRALHRA